MSGAVGVVTWASHLKDCRAANLKSAKPAKPEQAILSRIELIVNSHEAEQILVDDETSVAGLQTLVQQRTTLLPSRQCWLISEDRIRHQNFSTAMWRAKTQFSSMQQDMRAAFISSINFMFLPEMFNRELTGRGLISFVKSTKWFQGLSEAQSSCQMRVAESEGGATGARKIRVEQLSGQTLMFEVDTVATIRELKLAVQQRLGIMVEQQRLLVLEKQELGVVGQAANTLLLNLFRGFRIGVSTATHLATTLLSKPEASFEVTLHTTHGRHAVMPVNGDTTINELRRGLAEKTGCPLGEDLSRIHLPSKMPPASIKSEPESHVLRMIAS